jgi:hypothetical protein
MPKIFAGADFAFSSSARRSIVQPVEKPRLDGLVGA